jgi:hypothetical protein
VSDLQTQLRARLTAVMSTEGPQAAVRVCADEAQALTQAVAKAHGASGGRASLRQRNATSPPPDWVASWLQTQGERKGEGVQGMAETVDTPAGRVARVLQPIVIAEPCLACHGAAETIAPAVKEVLAARYPNDRATGYALGDLRGAAWAEVAVAGR